MPVGIEISDRDAESWKQQHPQMYLKAIVLQFIQ